MRQRVEQDFNQDLKQLGAQNFYPPRGSREKHKHVRCISSVVSGNLFEDVQIYLKLILNPAIHVNFLKKKCTSMGHLDTHLAISQRGRTLIFGNIPSFIL